MDDTAALMLVEVKVVGGEASIRQLKSVEKATDGAGGAHKRSSKSAKEHEKALSKLNKAAGVLALGGIAAVTAGLVESVKAGVKWEEKIVGLGNTLKNAHLGNRKTAEALGNTFEKASEHGGFGAEEQIKGYQQFLSVTKSKTKAMQDNNLVMNIARSRGIEYSAAQTMVAQLETGKIGRLERQFGYLPKVTEATKKLTEAESTRKTELKKLGETFSRTERQHFEQLRQRAKQEDQQATAVKAKAAIESKVRNATKEYSKTIAGQWSNLKSTIDNAARSIGTKLLPTVTKVFKAVISGFTWLIKHKEVAIILGSVALAIWGMSAALSAYNAVMRVSATLEAINASTSLLMWGAIGLGIVVAVVAIVEIVKHFQWFKKIAENVFHAVLGAIKTAWNWVKQNWPLLLPILLGPLGIVIGGFIHFKKQIIGVFESIINWIDTAFHNVVHFLESIPGKIVHAFMKLPGLLGGILNKIPGVSLLKGAIGGVGHALGLNSGGLVPGFASGGVVPGYGSRDSVPAMLTPGEFIVRKQAVQSIGVGTLNALNGSNQAQGSGGGEFVADVPVQIINKLDSRVLSESTTRYTTKLRRRT